MNRKFHLIICILCLAFVCEAKVKLPALISDGMVLQREQDVRIWGKADPGEAVKLTFLGKHYQATAQMDGYWQISVPALKAGGPYAMKINDIEINDILVGDVFLCSGQSNMELPVSRVMDMFGKEIETDSNNPNIRHFKVPLAYNFHEPQTDITPTSWKALSSENVMSFSALAYFFAKDLYAKTKVPVGLINSSVGGSPAEAWISEEGLKAFPQYLNDKQMYESDDYVKEVRTMESQRQNLWNVILYRGDMGLQEQIPWYANEYDDSSWMIMDLFAKKWATDGLHPINGSHWFRKEFEINQSQIGQKAILRLGCIVDADSVYVNGVFVGTVSYQYPPRIYSIPDNLLREGKNTVTIRLISYSGFPSFVEEKPYKIIIGKDEINLEGEWRYKRGCAMPGLPGQTFFQYKPVGLYNSMIAPVQHYTISGVVWYQGESNVSKNNEYSSLLSALIKDWRKQMKQTQLPFYIIELASFLRPEDKNGQAAWAALRTAQAEAADKNEKVKLVRNSDLGEWNDIHPLDKKTLGKRLSESVWQGMNQKNTNK